MNSKQYSIHLFQLHFFGSLRAFNPIVAFSSSELNTKNNINKTRFDPTKFKQSMFKQCLLLVLLKLRKHYVRAHCVEYGALLNQDYWFIGSFLFFEIVLITDNSNCELCLSSCCFMNEIWVQLQCLQFFTKIDNRQSQSFLLQRLELIII